MARRTWRKCLHSKSITGKAGRICIAWRESDDGGGYGQETLPNALPDGGGLLTDHRARAAVGRPCPTQGRSMNARSLDGGGLPTDYYGQPAVRRPCPTQGRSMVEVSRPTTTDSLRSGDLAQRKVARWWTCPTRVGRPCPTRVGRPCPTR